MLFKFLKIKHLITVILILLVIALPSLTKGAGLVPCGGAGEAPCNACFLLKMAEGIMTFMVNMVGIVATAFLVVGGSLLVLSGANKKWYDLGKTVIFNALVGTSIVLLAWVLVNTVLTISGFTRVNVGLTGSWFELQCSTQPGTVTPGDDTPPPGDDTPPPGDGTPPPVTGGETPNTCSLPCSNPKFNPSIKNWTASECNAALGAAAPSADENSLVKAIMWQENGRNSGLVDPRKQSKKHACGPMQMLPGTARGLEPVKFKGESDTKVCEYLKSNPTYAVALSTRYIRDVKSSSERANTSKGYQMDVLELTGAGYNAGPGRNHQVSNDCGPSKPCNDRAEAKFSTPVPIWKCPFNLSNGECKVNTGFAETRKYGPNIVSATNYFKSCK